MLSMAMPLRVIDTPLACDTLLVTLSPHYSVLHQHANNPQQLPSLIRPYQQTHRIILLSSHPESTRQALEVIEKAKYLTNQNKIASSEAEQDVQDSRCPQLLKSLLQSIEDKKSKWIHLKNIVNSTNTTINRIQREQVNQRPSKRQQKVAKIKVKEQTSFLKQIQTQKSSHSHHQQLITLDRQKEQQDLQLLEQLRSSNMQGQSSSNNLLSMDSP